MGMEVELWQTWAWLRTCWCPRQGSCRGTVVVPGKGLAGGSHGFPWLGSRRGSSSSGPHLISCVYDLDKDLHATTEAPPEPWFQCSCWRCLELLGSRAARCAGVGQVAPARLLPGPRRSPRQGSCRGSPPRPSVLCVFGLGIALVVLCFGLSPASLLCPAKSGRGAWL